jgi:hypothetical protein
MKDMSDNASTFHVSLIQLRGNSMKRLALAALSITVLSGAIAPATFAFNDRLETGFTAARQNLGALNPQTTPDTAPNTMAQNAPNQEDCLTKQGTTALNERFDRARRQNLDLALNDRFDEARRQNLDLALNDRFDEARRQNLDLALNDRFDEARRRNLNS